LAHSLPQVFSAPMDETYEMLGLDAADTTTLEQYMDDYFGRILKKLKEVGGKSRQKDLYVSLLFRPREKRRELPCGS
jgi:hypothetical protein